MRFPAKDALIMDEQECHVVFISTDLPTDIVSITLLLVRKGVEVFLDLEPNHARGRVSKIAAKFLGCQGHGVTEETRTRRSEMMRPGERREWRSCMAVGGESSSGQKGQEEPH